MNKPGAEAKLIVGSKRLRRQVTPTTLNVELTRDISVGMNAILADVFALYIKTKNFHWHMSGPHFRDYSILLAEQARELYAMTDPIAERIRKLGGSTIRSIGHIARHQRVLDNDAEYVSPLEMFAELRDDNKALANHLREAHNFCDVHRDFPTAALIERWIDESECRMWVLLELGRKGNATGRR
jgi:starvation-inducible DNA-binding protein